MRWVWIFLLLCLPFAIGWNVAAAAPAHAEPGLPGNAAGVVTANVPILMYHHVGAPFQHYYNVPLSNFEAQMAYLAHNGYTAVSVDQVAAALRGQGNLPTCPVAITFDDGYADAYDNAVPVLRKYGFHATFYIVTSYISTSKMFMNWDQVRTLADHGMVIGSHSHTHPYLTHVSGYTLTHQIAGSKAKLEARLGISITTFSHPYGDYNELVTRILSDTGYTSAVGIGYTFRQSSERIYKMSRTAVYSDVTLPLFIARLPRRSPDGKCACPLPFRRPVLSERRIRRHLD